MLSDTDGPLSKVFLSTEHLLDAFTSKGEDPNDEPIKMVDDGVLKFTGHGAIGLR